MVESGGDDDSIIFNKENIRPKIITITKDRVINDKKSESMVIINKGRNKIQMNIENKNKKINKEEIIKSLKNIKKIEIDNFDPNYNSHKNKSGISPYNYFKTSQNNLVKIAKKEKEKEKENLRNNEGNLHINDINQNIYDKKLNPIKINVIKNLLLKKEKEQEQKDQIGEQNKISSFNINDKYLFSKGDNNNIDINRQSDRYSLRNSSSDYNIATNSNINYNNNFSQKQNNNYSEDIKQESNRGIDKIREFYLNKKEISRNNTLTIDRRNSTHLITSIVNMLHSTSENTLTTSNYDKCLICERAFSIINLCCSECNKHFFCRRCLKNYCREKIEKGEKRMKCPITKCKYNIYEEFLKSILSEDYYHLLYRKSKSLKSDDKTIESDNISRNKFDKFEIFSKKIKHNSIDKKKRIKLYNNKHVIDINSNIMLYNMSKYKDEYCPNCSEQTLFCHTSTLFNKCLNCGFKICKYCNKKFTKTHLIFNCEDHCTIYFRKIGNNSLQNNYFYDYFMQLIYVIAMFYITFAFCFLSIFNFLGFIFRMRKNKENVCMCLIYRLKYFLCILISVVLFIIIFPILFIWTPYFPSIIALIDGY